MSLALQGGFLTTGPPGKPPALLLYSKPTVTPLRAAVIYTRSHTGMQPPGAQNTSFLKLPVTLLTGIRCWKVHPGLYLSFLPNLHSWQTTLAARRNWPHFLPHDLSWSSSLHVSLCATQCSQVAPQLRLCLYRMETVLPKELVTLELCPCTQPCSNITSGGDMRRKWGGLGLGWWGWVVLEKAGHIFAEVGSTARASMAWCLVAVHPWPGRPRLWKCSQLQPARYVNVLRTFSSHLYSAPVSISIQELSKLMKWSFRIHFLPLISMILFQADPWSFGDLKIFSLLHVC